MPDTTYGDVPESMRPEPDDPEMLDEMGPECSDCPLYLVCRQCGEAFHLSAIDSAHSHTSEEHPNCGSYRGFDILPECAAM